MEFRDELEKALVELLYALWRSVDYDLKSKYAREIWRMFGDAVAVGARTSGSNIAAFVGFVARKLDASLASDAWAASAVAALAPYDGYELLRRLREDGAYLVALTRVYNEQMKERSGER